MPADSILRAVNEEGLSPCEYDDYDYDDVLYEDRVSSPTCEEELDYGDSEG